MINTCFWIFYGMNKLGIKLFFTTFAKTRSIDSKGYCVNFDEIRFGIYQDSGLKLCFLDIIYL